METLKLSEIVLSVTPELYQWLTAQERDITIVLRDGLNELQTDDVLEIIEASIMYKNDALH